MSLTLTPMMSADGLTRTNSEPQDQLSNWLEQVWDRPCAILCDRGLIRLLRHEFLMLLVTLGLVGLTAVPMPRDSEGVATPAGHRALSSALAQVARQDIAFRGDVAKNSRATPPSFLEVPAVLQRSSGWPRRDQTGRLRRSRRVFLIQAEAVCRTPLRYRSDREAAARGRQVVRGQVLHAGHTQHADRARGWSR